MRTGEPLEGPVSEPLRVFKVRLEGEDILVET
jgi:nitrite reductase/ring-hydroxylating ferredoxin subunit